MTNFPERRIHSAFVKFLTGGSCSRTTEILDGSAGALPSRKTIRHSLLVIRLFAIRHLLLSVRRSPIAGRQSPVAVVLTRQEPRPPNPSTDSKSVSAKTKPAEAG